jgi:hypothetical protein
MEIGFEPIIAFESISFYMRNIQFYFVEKVSGFLYNEERFFDRIL